MAGVVLVAVVAGRASRAARDAREAQEMAERADAKGPDKASSIDISQMLTDFENDGDGTFEAAKDRPLWYSVRTDDSLLMGRETVIVSRNGFFVSAYFDVTNEPKKTIAKKGQTVLLRATRKRAALKTLFFENCAIE